MACHAGTMLRMDGKVAFISGVGSSGPGWGNGKATATLLARQGAVVFGVDVSQEAAAETRGVIESEGGTCVVVVGEAARSTDVAAAGERCVQQFCRIVIIVN